MYYQPVTQVSELSADVKFDGLRDLIPRGVDDGKRVRGGFSGRDVQASRVGRPDFAGGRIESDSLGVGDVIAELRGFAGMDCGGRDIKAADGKFGPA
jgi:hypothetical protein